MDRPHPGDERSETVQVDEHDIADRADLEHADVRSADRDAAVCGNNEPTIAHNASSTTHGFAQEPAINASEYRADIHAHSFSAETQVPSFCESL